MAKRILVINDTLEILELFEELLTEEGYEVILYSFATHDTDEITRHHPDLIILDYIFGTENLGWQLLQKLKMRHETASIPVIICTAAVREVREIEGFLLAKGVKLVPKPFDIDDLLSAVSSALEMPHVAAALIDESEHLEAKTEQSKLRNSSSSPNTSDDAPGEKPDAPGKRRGKPTRES